MLTNLDMNEDEQAPNHEKCRRFAALKMHRVSPEGVKDPWDEGGMSPLDLSEHTNTYISTAGLEHGPVTPDNNTAN